MVMEGQNNLQTNQERAVTEAKKLKEAGNKDFRNGDYAGATQLYKKAMSVMYSVVWTKDQSLHDEAMALLEACRLNLAAAHSKLGEYAQAIEVCNNALRSAKVENPKALYRRGMACFASGDLPKALDDLTKAAVLLPHDEVVARELQNVKTALAPKVTQPKRKERAETNANHRDGVERAVNQQSSRQKEEQERVLAEEKERLKQAKAAEAAERKKRAAEEERARQAREKELKQKQAEQAALAKQKAAEAKAKRKAEKAAAEARRREEEERARREKALREEEAYEAALEKRRQELEMLYLMEAEERFRRGEEESQGPQPSAHQPAPERGPSTPSQTALHNGVASKRSKQKKTSSHVSPSPPSITPSSLSTSTSAPSPSQPPVPSARELFPHLFPPEREPLILKQPAESPMQGYEASEDRTCIICMERERNALALPCGHLSSCDTCLNKVHKSGKPNCPICRVDMTEVVLIYQ